MLSARDRSATLPVALAGGVVLAAAGAVAAPDATFLPGPQGLGEQVLAWAILAAAFAVGTLRPRASLYALVVVLVAEGAVRRWVVNDVVVFLVKDFLLLGIYAATLPRLTRADLRRPWWLLAPMAALLALTLVYAARTPTLEQAAVGLRAWWLYVPLLWVAPKLLDTPARGLRLAVLVLGLGVAEAVLGAVQALTGDPFLNRPTPGTAPAVVVSGVQSFARPAGTLLQVGAYSAFLVFPIVVALALAATSRGRRLAAAAGAVFFLVWGVTFAGARALTATSLLAAAVFAVAMLAQRRFVALAAVAVAAVAGSLAIQNISIAGGEVHRIDYEQLGANGEVVKSSLKVWGIGGDAVEAFRSRGARVSATDEVEGGVHHDRIREQLDVIRDQGLAGEGTGTMTIGSGYVTDGTAKIAGESMYTKAATELGLPGLLVFCAYLAALAAAAVLGWWRARGGAAQTVALVGAGAALLVPLASVLTFALDTPVVAALFYAFVGIAAAAASSGSSRSTIAGHASSRS